MQRFDARKRLNVLVVDDNLEHSKGIKQLLESETNHNVAAIATSGSDAMKHIKKSKPDIILMDMNMPEMDGLTTIQKLLDIDSNCKIITLTGYDDQDLVFRAMKLGARGYVLKTMVVSQLTDAIEQVKSGKVYLPTNLATKFFDQFHIEINKEQFAEPEGENLLNYLTQREEEVLTLLAQGITYKGVARDLYISETTVKTHVNNIFQKLQVNDRTQAVLYAIKHGLLDKVKVAV
ncbi:MAG: response regulator transcription factor [Cyanobacteriota bacterium]